VAQTIGKLIYIGSSASC